MTTRKFEIAIIGAGPAGCATAIHLARLGRYVLLLDKQHPPQGKIGECLSPKARPLLARLGVLARMDVSGCLPYLGNRSLWGSDEPFFLDFMREPFGNGWRLARDQFDLMLRQAAIARGAIFVHGSLHDMTSSDSGHELVIHAKEQLTLRADWIVDATGRSSAVAARFGARRTFSDSLVAHILFADGMPDDDHFITIESHPAGWWYSVALAYGTVAVLHTRPREIEEEAALFSLLAETKLTKTKMSMSAATGKLRRALANSSRLNSPVGDRWIAVGDASAAFDPISSYGILHALQSGTLAAELIDAALSGKTERLSQYAAHEAGVFARHLAKKRETYSAEARWPHSMFWNSI